MMVSFGSLAAKVFGTSNDRLVKGYRPRVEAINALEASIESLSDDELRARTHEFREQVANGTSLDDLLVPAFATVREAAKRTLGQRHFDVQLIGGMVLNDGNIAEMKTGEGKTLVGTLAVYLNALTGRGVHVVTVNDYLAKRDAEWMGQVYRFLGLTVGVILNDMDDDQRKAAYDSDVTYCTNNELGFDYLRDNMKMSVEEMVQRGHYFSIVDEVDSILVDEARTPLIISGPLEDRSELYTAIDEFIPQLLDSDYELDEKQRQVTFTDEGNENLEAILEKAGHLKGASLYDAENVTVVHHVNQALKAHKLFQRDKDYIVKDDQVVIIDEFTGRMMEGRRFSDGLHQALEAKEHVTIQPENQTLASITFQNYFRLYEKLSGMTGTAATEAEEFMNIYGLDVIEIPTNVDIGRIDDDDEVYRTQREKYAAIIELIHDCSSRGQPILVGTTSIEKSELLSDLLKDKKFLKEIGIDKPVPHQVLNARYHEQEASIIAQAGVPSAVTIATNMAGRGTDIQLGGNLDMIIDTWVDAQCAKGKAPDQSAIDAKKAALESEVAEKKKIALDAGGLYVVGTERHESRRIDNQLRGRSGRQGDPGHSKFYLSLEDDLMRIFGSERMDSMLVKLGLEEGEAITHPWINKALEKAQSKVEARNFDARKFVLKYDDVMNDQRKVIFEQRIDLMAEEDVSETVTDMRHELIDGLISQHIPENAYAEQWDAEGLTKRIKEIFDIDAPVTDWAAEEGIADEEIHERLLDLTDQAAARKVVDTGSDVMRQIEKMVLLQTLDHLWRDHLVTLEHLRQVVGLRSYGQRDPLNEYKSEGFTLFEGLLTELREAVTMQLMHLNFTQEAEAQLYEQQGMPEMELHHVDPLTGEDEYGSGRLDMDTNIYDDSGSAHGDEEGSLALKQRPAQSRVSASEINPDDPSTWGKVARNKPCPCGSGKKYKHCHGKF